MKNTFLATVSGGTLGFLVGLGLATGAFKDTSKALSLAGLGGLITGVATHIYYDGKLAKKEREASERLDNTLSEVKRLEKDYQDSVDKFNKAAKNHKELTDKLQSEKTAVTQQLELVSQALEILKNERTNQDVFVSELNATIKNLEQSMRERDTRIIELEQETEQLKTDCAEWDKSFIPTVEAKAQERLQQLRKAELEKIFNEHDSIMLESFSIMDDLQNWVMKVKRRNTERRDFVLNLTDGYNQTLDEYSKSTDEQVQHYLNQIELLQEKVATLQRELKGDLIEPIYGQFGYHRAGNIGNDIARVIFTDLRIPLAVTGFKEHSDGSVDVGYSYSKLMPVEAIIEPIESSSKDIARKLGLFKITNVKKLEISDCLVISYRTEPYIKEDEIKSYVGSPDEFIKYITTYPVRYRIMANPGEGKTPSIAVMISEILKAGTKQGNVMNGKRVPNTLVSVAYPDATTSLKDGDNYPLNPFLRYGDTTQSLKSFKDALEDWEYRKHNISYSKEFFQLWVWEELDYTLGSIDDAKSVTEKLKLLLQKGGHNNIGYICSGQSIMTKEIPGFTNDDRSLFTEMVIGVSKIRKYLQVYGKGRNSDTQLQKLDKTLDLVEDYIDSKNALISDSARYLRLALIKDERSPKLFFLPNLDSANFDTQAIEDLRTQSHAAKVPNVPNSNDAEKEHDSQKPYTTSIDTFDAVPSIPPMYPSSHSGSLPHCPHCDSTELTYRSDKRYYCKSCKKKFVESKTVWK